MDSGFFGDKTDNSWIIIHLILGQDNSQSGKHFNEASMKLMKIIELDAEISKFDLLAKLNRYWEEKNGIYFTTFREEKEIPPLFRIAGMCEVGGLGIFYIFKKHQRNLLVGECGFKISK